MLVRFDTHDSVRNITEPQARKGVMKAYIESFGCQMNFLEDELLKAVLVGAGWEIVGESREADVVLVNGCLVRRHAEERALSRVGTLKREGARLVGVVGCLARRIGGIPGVSLLVSPENYKRLPEAIAEAARGGAALLGYEGVGVNGLVPRSRPGTVAWVAISRGCDNFCSYCVVPYARGRETCRCPDDILREIESLAERGCREVTLLGQNVNSYRSGGTDFPGLLERIDRAGAVLRVRFLTSHPRDIGGTTLEVVSRSSTVCEHLHLPLQSGSDRLLRRMNRGYTVERYWSLIERARELMPTVGLTTDLMVGFPGEEEWDFDQTLALVREIQFDAAFTFGYSSRPGTAAARMADSLPPSVVGRRLSELISTVREVAEERLRRRLGSVVQVLIEGESPKTPADWRGRSREGNVVVFPRAGERVGDIASVKVEELRGFTLRGRNAASAGHPATSHAVSCSV